MEAKPTREEAKRLLAEYLQQPYPSNHIALVIWRSPITDTLNVRSGAFVDYNEALGFADMLAEQYLNHDFPFVVYLDGCLHKHHRDDELLDD